jgi:hypothetical protein
MFRRLIGLTAPFWLLAGCAHRSPPEAAPPTPAPYVRINSPTAGGVQLEIAARQFAPRRGRGPTVWLTAVSHLGDATYYQSLQTHLDACTQVLFEGVGASDKNFGRQRSGAERAAAPGSSLQSQLAQALGLQFQLEAIDYDRAQFQNSDLGVAELRELMARPLPGAQGAAADEAARSFEQLMAVMQGEGLFSRFLGVGLRWLGTQPRYQALAKLSLMEMIDRVQGDLDSLGSLPGGMRELLRVLIEERNAKVLADLRGAVATAQRGDSISIFYGAGHMSDLEVRLRTDFGYEPRGEIWFPAISVNLTAAGVTSAEVAATREMIRRQVETLRARPQVAP